MKASICFSTALLILAAGCSKKTSDDAVQASAVVSAASAAPSVAPTSSVAAADEDSDIELPEDFAEEATEDITAQNLDSQLAALEKEVDNDS